MVTFLTVVLQLPDDAWATPSVWSWSTAIRAGLVTRARIVLAAADGRGLRAEPQLGVIT